MLPAVAGTQGGHGFLVPTVFRSHCNGRALRIRWAEKAPAHPTANVIPNRPHDDNQKQQCVDISKVINRRQCDQASETDHKSV